MKYIKNGFSLVFLLLIASTFSGCWNYIEVEKLAVVSGVAVDKKDDGYSLTFEIVDVKGGRDSKISTRLITSEGVTIGDAVRKAIKTVGRKLYLSHAEIILVSTNMAEEGIIPVVDVVARQAEARDTLHFLVSKEKSAKEILEQKPITADVLCFQLNDTLDSQKKLSYATDVEVWQFMNDLSQTGISATMPTVDLTAGDNRSTPEIAGTGVFRKDKLVGFLDGEETKTMLFIKDKISGGLLVNKEYNKDHSETNITVEILENRTKLKPHNFDGKITIEIETDTDVSIGEIGGRENYIEEPERTKLKKDFEAMLENNITGLVKKTQEKYDSDIFGFGKKVKLDMPGLWKQVEPQWEQIYKNVSVEVHSTINIKNSAFRSKPVKVGD